MPRIGALLDVTDWSQSTAESWLRYERVMSPDVADMVLDSISARLPAGASARLALYTGGASDTDPTGATLIADVGVASNPGGAAAVITVPAGKQPIPRNARLWLGYKATNEQFFHANDDEDNVGDLLGGWWEWAPDGPSDLDTPWAATVPQIGAGMAVQVNSAIAFDYSIGPGGTPGNASGALGGAAASTSAPAGNASASRAVSITLRSAVGVPLSFTERRFWTRTSLDGPAVDGGVGGLSVVCNNSGVFELTNLSVDAGPGWLTYKDPNDDLNCHTVPVVFE